MTFRPLRPWLHRVLGLVVLSLASGQALAAPCVRRGFPVGCTVGPDPVLNSSPGVGYGAPGVGARPAAGPGAGPNYGGPVNVNPVASPGAGPNAGGPVNRAGWR